LIDDRDVTCVTLAGLVHDLGHGPFSHMFEVFVNRCRETTQEEKFEHEEMSMKILRHLLEKNAIHMHEYMHTTVEEVNPS
jgi:deoxynucleoside triphosphate triphosphohydrolase SAMHD1